MPDRIIMISKAEKILSLADQHKVSEQNPVKVSNFD